MPQGIEKKSCFSFTDVVEMLREKEKQGNFYGEVSLTWQNSKMVLWREVTTKKPKSRET